jgi:hypothetical protein
MSPLDLRLFSAQRSLHLESAMRDGARTKTSVIVPSSLRARALASLVAGALALAACGQSGTGTQTGAGGSSGTSSTTNGSTTGTTGGGGEGGSLPVDKAAGCASTFGDGLTNAFGRLDGTVLAVVPPAHPTCAMPNGTHLVLQVTAGGAAYRMVVNVKSDGADPDVFYRTLAHPLPAPAWAEGWHPGLTLDYVADLGVHADASFAQHTMTELVQLVSDAIALGTKISVYATSSGGASAHLVHRNSGKTDGVIVVDPEGASPTMLLFHFPTQSF